MKKVKVFTISILSFGLVLMGCNSTHNHTFSSEWSFDESYHWHDATCGHDVKGDLNPHSFVTDEDNITSTCSVCGYKTLSPASGYINYTNVSGEEKAKIISKLEKYVLDNQLTGIPLYGDGNFVMHASNYKKEAETYIPGYGFGELAEGTITSDLPGETNKDYARYWHSYITDDPKNILAMNDKGYIVNELASHVTAKYYEKRMNESKDGYKWYPSLATDRPTPINPDENGLSNTFKIPVKVGSEVKYSINTSVNRLTKYNNREVVLEDYITTYQIYFTSAYRLARSTENLVGDKSILGTKDYYELSRDGFNQDAWNNVGIKSYTEDKPYLEFTFNNKLSVFEVMEYLSNPMFAPVPKDFILDCGGVGNTNLSEGVKNWGTFSNDKKETPVDHFLTTGPYELEKWNENETIIFKRNHNSIYGNRYQIEGVHYRVLKDAKNDEEIAFNEFLNGRLSSIIVPKKYIFEYRDDPRTSTTSNSGIRKLNLNTCDEEMWEKLFGENGSVTKTPKDKYWEVEPAMSVKEFVKGISYSLNRVEIAKNHDRTIGYEFFGDTYLSDPENGISYNSTKEHKEAINDFVEGTDGYGYSLELAKENFKIAATKLIDEGHYSKGDTIHIEIAWQDKNQAEEHKDIKKYIEDAFNNADTGLSLSVDYYTPEVWSDIYFKKMMVGQFDIGFGSISGSSMKPEGIYLLELLKSDNSSGFTLNWGKDTSEVTKELEYDGYYWSFDSLWLATAKGALFLNGNEFIYGVDYIKEPEIIRNKDGSLSVYLYVYERKFDENNYTFLRGISLFATTDTKTYDDYEELVILRGDSAMTYDEVNFCYKFTFSSSDISAWLKKFPADKVAMQGMDLYIENVVDGKSSGSLYFDTFYKGLIPAIP